MKELRQLNAVRDLEFSFAKDLNRQNVSKIYGLDHKHLNLDLFSFWIGWWGGILPVHRPSPFSSLSPSPYSATSHPTLGGAGLGHSQGYVLPTHSLSTPGLCVLTPMTQ